MVLLYLRLPACGRVAYVSLFQHFLDYPSPLHRPIHHVALSACATRIFKCIVSVTPPLPLPSAVCFHAVKIPNLQDIFDRSTRHAHTPSSPPALSLVPRNSRRPRGLKYSLSRRQDSSCRVTICRLSSSGVPWGKC